MSRVRKHAQSVGLAGLLAALAVAGTSLAGGGTDAENADKVDGKHAVGSGASVNARKGKLVATDPGNGRLPNNIISKAPDSQQLDGKDSSAFAEAIHQHSGDDITTKVAAAKDSDQLGGKSPSEYADVNHNHDTSYAAATHNHDADYASTTHTHDAGAIVSGVLADARIGSEITRDNEVMNIVLGADGSGSELSADTLDGLNSTAFAAASHDHDAGSIVSGVLADARIGSAIARDNEVMGIVTAGDGEGSGLNADFLDGTSSANFVKQANTPTIAIQANIHDWSGAFGVNETRIQNSGDLVVSTPAATAVPYVLNPTTPSVLYGKDMQLVDVEFCYDATAAGATLSEFQVILINNASGTPISSVAASDSTDRDDQTCRTYTPQFFLTIGDNDHISLNVDIDVHQANGEFRFRRTTIHLRQVE